MVPAVAVLGVGATVEEDPPVATVYHLRILPDTGVAVNAVDVAPWQYVTGVVTVGAGGDGFTTTVRAALVPSHTPPNT